MPITQLEYERWRKDLIRMLPAEPRLRIFARGRIWLNPYSGEFVSGIPREDGKITFRTVSAMAQQLCMDTKARSGRMLEPWAHRRAPAQRVRPCALAQRHPGGG